MRTNLIVIGLSLSLGLSAQPSAAQEQERTAEQTYKNIQVLKGVSASQFMNTMFFQRYALGVSCSYCHVDGQWDKDDKPAKVKAREMIRMVLDINKNAFHDKQAVNCVTCHRGTTKPQTEIVAARQSFDVMLGPKRRSPAPTPATQSVDAVLDRYIVALGGRDSLAKITSTTTRGNLIGSEGLIAPFEETYASGPNRWVSVRHFGGTIGDFSSGYDADVAWNKDNRGLTIYSGLAKARAVMRAELQTGLRMRELYADLSVVGTEDVGGNPATVLAGRARLTGLRERLYFDIETGLLVRRSVLTEAAFGAYTSDTFYENYRTIDGIKLPILVSEFSPDDGTVRKITSVEHNATLSPDVFRKPPAPF